MFTINPAWYFCSPMWFCMSEYIFEIYFFTPLRLIHVIPFVQTLSYNDNILHLSFCWLRSGSAFYRLLQTYFCDIFHIYLHLGYLLEAGAKVNTSKSLFWVVIILNLHTGSVLSLTAFTFSIESVVLQNLKFTDKRSLAIVLILPLLG